jgi:hypothetical protein
MSSLPASSATQTAATAAADPITNQVFTGPTSYSRVVRVLAPQSTPPQPEHSRDERPTADGTKVLRESLARLAWLTGWELVEQRRRVRHLEP